jgi:hypothetical protein
MTTQRLVDLSIEMNIERESNPIVTRIEMLIPCGLHNNIRIAEALMARYYSLKDIIHFIWTIALRYYSKHVMKYE